MLHKLVPTGPPAATSYLQVGQVCQSRVCKRCIYLTWFKAQSITKHGLCMWLANQARGLKSPIQNLGLGHISGAHQCGGASTCLSPTTDGAKKTLYMYDMNAGYSLKLKCLQPQP